MKSPLPRRRFLTRLSTAAAALSLPRPAPARPEGHSRIRIGMISDIHHDVMPDGPRRLRAFLDAMRTAQPDFIIQLGDFCKPTAANQPFLDLWNSHPGPRYHVLGNHDMDGGFPRDHTAAWYGMPGRHYGFDHRGMRFLVLDGNDPGGTGSGYHRFIGQEQQAWLESELASTRLPVVLFIHQPLDHEQGVVNRDAIRAVLETDRGPDHAGVAAVFSGHCHQDYVRRLNGIPHVQINSASYVWLPAHARRQVYDADTHKRHPYLDHVAAYRDPLWALVTLDAEGGTLSIEGRTSEWVGPDPWERGAPEKEYPRDRQRPMISPWQGPLGKKA